MTNKEAAQPELSDVAVSAMAVEEMLKDLLPKMGMWEIEGDEAKTAICEVIRDALEGLWKLPFVKPNSKESSLTQKALDTISRHIAIEKLKRRKKFFCENRIEFSLLPENDKSRVDEIDACIEMLMNLPSAQQEVTEEEVKEYCRKRCLSIVDSALLKKYASARPTLYGYNIEHLELIARVLQKENLPPERIVEALTDIGSIVAIVRDEFEETLRKAVEQCMI